MRKKKPTIRERKIAIDPHPQGNLKALSGGQYDDWNNWLASRTSEALPVNQKDDDRATEATVAVWSGMIDLKPADPIEGILISQLVAANQTSLEMYRRAWALSSEYFEARTCMRKKKPTVRERKIAIDPNPQGNLKPLGGGQYDDWNNWLASRTSLALPVNQMDDDRATEATVAVFSGMIALKPADPIEGILISQLVAANQTSLEMYRRAWALSSEYFEARTCMRKKKPTVRERKIAIDPNPQGNL